MNITYYTGAGASVGCIPIFAKKEVEKNNKFAEEIGVFKNMVAGWLHVHRNLERHDKNLQIIKKIEELENNCKDNPTIDTYAKKLFIKEDKAKLTELKKMLTAFLIFLQFTKKPDERYDKFIAALIEKEENEKLLLPDNIKVITWNYDISFEIALAQYKISSNIDLLNEIQETLNVFPSDIYKNDDEEVINICKFSIVKLNGTAGLFNDPNKKDYFSRLPVKFEPIKAPAERDEEENVLSTIIDIINSKNDKHSENNLELFSYAWEKSKVCQKGINAAIEIAKETEILIIIGYSFPFVNRIIDEKIINSMKRLKKIYIQDMFYHEQTENRIILFKNMFPILKGNTIKIEIISDLREFYIPPEFNRTFKKQSYGDVKSY